MLDAQGMIQFFSVTKHYPRGGVALSDVTFRLAKGEFRSEERRVGKECRL